MKRSSLLKMLIVATVAIGFAACEGDDGPIAPVVNDGPTVTINGVALLKRPVGGLTLSESVTKRIRRYYGGALSLSDASLSIPMYGLYDDKYITMSHDDASNGLWAYDFSPSGLTFRRSATLTINATAAQLESMGVNPADLGVAHAPGSSSDDWSIIGGTWDPASESISVEIKGFSRYALCVE